MMKSNDDSNVNVVVIMIIIKKLFQLAIAKMKIFYFIIHYVTTLKC